MEHADVARLESDIAIQLEPPTNPDLIVAKIGRLTLPFRVRRIQQLYGIPASLAELKSHRLSSRTRRRWTIPLTPGFWD